MASTPPLRIISVHQPPPTPRHGPAHDDFEPRHSTRSSQRIASREAKTTPEPQSAPRTLRSATTPESKRLTARQTRHNLSPPISPRNTPKHTPAKRAQVLSPDSPGIRTRSHDTSSSNPSFTSSGAQQSFLSTSTVMTESMLPTPVKTPRKKVVSNVHVTARALFQEPPHASDEIMPTPKNSRKSKRHNGFSLESSARKNEAGSSVQIFTDSRDNVPELDLSEDNPFVDRPSKPAQPSIKPLHGTSKRRKLTAERKKDLQVDEAIKNDEGMVYVFRGKKVFKRFDDGSEEEEAAIDPNDLGLLEKTGVGAEALALLKPMTRRSIKPTRLFQTEEQKRTIEAEKAEEEVTDVEEEPSIDITESSVPTPDLKANVRQTRNTTATKSARKPNGNALDEAEDGATEVPGDGKSPIVGAVQKTKRGSPFDSWRRLKSVSTVGHSKGRKRTSSVLEEDEQPSAGKKLRNR